jgi:hypothetical protein
MEKQETVLYTLRIPVDLKKELERIAREQDRSLSRQIISVLRQYTKDHAAER